MIREVASVAAVVRGLDSNYCSADQTANENLKKFPTMASGGFLTEY
jgi:hypothetical protein